MIKKIFSAISAALKPNVVDAVVPTINVINKSKLLNDVDFQTMVEACKIQLDRDVAPMWLRGTWKIVTNQPDVVGYPIVILDDPDQAGALGYHTESPSGKVWGRVFVKPVIDGHGSMLIGSLSVAAVLSHEIIEAYCDPNVNLWADMNNGKMVCFEACDPVESDSYTVLTKAGKNVSVSNFVLPAWFDGQAAPGTKLDFMAKLQKPFTMTHGGYMVVFDANIGKVDNVFGSKVAETWHMARQLPHPASRSARKSRTKKK